MKGLYTNRSKYSDFVRNGIVELSEKVSNIDIAVAFFTESSVVEMLSNDNKQIRLIVRLGFPTSPTALRKMLTNKNVKLRYFSSKSFHSKLYIFGDDTALVGSANLTNAAIFTNQEVSVSIDSNDVRFFELVELFSDYWDQANVLTSDDIDAYELLFDKYNISNDLYSLEKDIEKNLRKCEFKNIDRGSDKKSKIDIRIEEYRKIYQDTNQAFNKILEIYDSIGRRRIHNKDIPLRVEIDSFISFTRDKYAKKGKWDGTKLGWNKPQINHLKEKINEWLATDYEYFDHDIVNEKYPLITDTFSSEEIIQKLSYDELVNGLLVLHSFSERKRYFKGGIETFIKAFKDSNDLQKVKNSLSYLLFSTDVDLPTRMAHLIYEQEYKIKEFAQANIQELVGWVNNENYPVINSRTTKVLRYFGLDVVQIGNKV